MRIAIVNCWHDDNKGDSAIVWGTLKAFKMCVQNPSFTLLSVFSKESPFFKTSFRHTIRKFPNVEIRPFPIPNRLELDRWRWVMILIRSMNPLKVSKDLGLLDNVDLVISKGGHYFVDYGRLSGIFHIYTHSYPLLLAWRKKVPFGIYGHSIGPLRSPLARYLIRTVFKKAMIVGVREFLSKEELKRCGFSPDSVNLLPDLAFMLEPSLTKCVENLLQRHNLKPDEFVIITPRQWFFKGESSRYIDYLDVLAGLIRHLRINGLKVVILAHTLGPSPFEDDRIACCDLLKRLSNHNGIYYVQEDLNPEELSAFYGCSRLVIGTRFHSIILAFVAGTPALAISYAGPKAPGIMDLFGLRAYTADISNLNLEALKTGVRHILHNKKDLQVQIQKKVSELRTNIITLTQKVVKEIK